MSSDSSEILFISDLHLTADRPFIIELFKRFINERAIYAEALYILGDFFEYWIGDDDPADELNTVFEAFDTLKEHDVPVYFMHGNRDFLIGQQFADKTHCQLISEPKHITVNDQNIVLLHGDSLCTHDIQYQEFKKQVRSESWQQDFTAKTLDERHAIIQSLRQSSKTETAEKQDEIMDVSQEAVMQLFQSENSRFIIHGHTHRPYIHEVMIDNKIPATRIVLGDWYKEGSLLSVKYQPDTSGIKYQLESFS